MWVVRVPLILLANAVCALTVCLYLWYLSDPLLVRSDVNHRTEVHNAILHETAELQGLSIKIHCHVHWASFYFTLSCFWDGDISINWIGDHVLWFWLLSGSCGLAYYGHDLGGLWIYRALQVWTIFSSSILNFLLNYTSLITDLVYCTAAFGLLWLCFCREYLSLVGCSNNHSSRRWGTVLTSCKISCSMFFLQCSQCLVYFLLQFFDRNRTRRVPV